MKSIAFLSLLGIASAHFRVNYPTWRGNSFAETASQWDYPCANVTELPANSPNRTAWPLTGGSLIINGSHEWALTYVNLGIGTNVSAFNISLLHDFNQTGAGEFCLKEAGKAAIEEGARARGISLEDLNGQQGTLQIIQIGHTGGALYNCADITFNSSAAVLSDDQCKNGTGVGGVSLHSTADGSQGESQQNGTTPETGAAALSKPIAAGSLLAGFIAVGVGLL